MDSGITSLNQFKEVDSLLNEFENKHATEKANLESTLATALNDLKNSHEKALNDLKQQIENAKQEAERKRVIFADINEKFIKKEGLENALKNLIAINCQNQAIKDGIQNEINQYNDVTEDKKRDAETTLNKAYEYVHELEDKVSAENKSYESQVASFKSSFEIQKSALESNHVNNIKEFEDKKKKEFAELNAQRNLYGSQLELWLIRYNPTIKEIRKTVKDFKKQ